MKISSLSLQNRFATVSGGGAKSGHCQGGGARPMIREVSYSGVGFLPLRYGSIVRARNCRSFRREGIWFEVSDPVTQERGWVLAQYLSSIDGPTHTQVATKSTAEPLTVKPASPKSNKRQRSAKPAVRALDRVATVDPWNPRSARRADRRRGVGLSMFAPRRMETERRRPQVCGME